MWGHNYAGHLCTCAECLYEDSLREIEADQAMACPECDKPNAEECELCGKARMLRPSGICQDCQLDRAAREGRDSQPPGNVSRSEDYWHVTPDRMD